MQDRSFVAQGFVTNCQATMNPRLVAAVTPFRFMDLPQEIRDDIYEAAIFDFTPPELFVRFTGLDPFPWRSMNTNVLLTSRKVYWEALDVIVRRAQLVMVSGPTAHRFIHCHPEISMGTLTIMAGLTVIHPKYRNFCIMNHHINATRSTGRPDASNSVVDWQFIIHQRDIKTFCHALMGKFSITASQTFGPKSIHTLVLRCPPTYAQRESMSIYEAQTRILQDYRTILHGFEDISIRGAGAGWETGLYAAVLQDIRSTKDLPEFIDIIRDLEQDGSEILQQTGDPEAANVSWTKALGVCYNASWTFCLSDTSFPVSARVFEFNACKLYAARWAQLRRQRGDECAFPVMDLWYKLIANRLSRIIPFIQKGGHLARRRGPPPPPVCDYVTFVSQCCRQSSEIGKAFRIDGWSPRPVEEAQFRFAVATLFRLLDGSTKAATAYAAIRRAEELAPDDESIRHERERVETWIRHLVDDGTLESFPEA